MGGFGSGRGKWETPTKETTEDRLAADVRLLHRVGALQPGVSFALRLPACVLPKLAPKGITCHADAGSVRLYGAEVTERVSLAWTPCTFGGRRPWWVCPQCGRRCATLYLADRRFACRRCADLVYPSTRWDLATRLAQRARRMRARLGVRFLDSLEKPFPARPKGMHLRTYRRLQEEHDRARSQCLQLLAARVAEASRHLTAPAFARMEQEGRL